MQHTLQIFTGETSVAIPTLGPGDTFSFTVDTNGAEPGAHGHCSLTPYPEGQALSVSAQIETFSVARVVLRNDGPQAITGYEATARAEFSVREYEGSPD